MLYYGVWGQEETINYLFLKCDFYDNLWHIVLHWLGICIVQSGDIGGHTLQFDGAHVFGKGMRACIQTIGMACIWLIWKERNARIFGNKQISLEQLFERVKLHSWWWIKTGTDVCSEFVPTQNIWFFFSGSNILIVDILTKWPTSRITFLFWPTHVSQVPIIYI